MDRLKANIESKLDGKLALVRIGEEELVVYIAHAAETRQKGLRDFEEMPYDGMLFIYEEKSTAKFSVSNMNFDISLHWFNGLCEHVGTFESTQEETIAEPPSGFNFVVETYLDVPAGDLEIITILTEAEAAKYGRKKKKKKKR